ncbi:MAG: Fic family protein [Planctomycetota bacterium]|nr:Fic family protein [Planctomycetota bacterium]
MSCDPLKPYNALPDLPPAGACETVAVLKHCITAARSLAELKAASSQLPNPALLTHNLVLLEAQASSEIENIVTTHDELFSAERHPADQLEPATKEALRYRDALWVGLDALAAGKPLCTNVYISIMQCLRGTDAGLRSTPGTTLSNPSSGEVFYTPPEGEALLRDRLGALDRFIHDPQIDLDPLIKIALTHYQFEAIHPFADGNGRSGRILCILQLLAEGLLSEPVLYLSGAILADKSTYYERLRAVTLQADWEGWLCYFLQAINRAAKQAVHTIAQIRQRADELEQHIRQHLPAKAPHHALAELLVELPYCGIASLVERGLAKRQTAASYLQQLVDSDAGFSVRKIGRENMYVHDRLIAVLSQGARHDYKLQDTQNISVSRDQRLWPKP